VSSLSQYKSIQNLSESHNLKQIHFHMIIFHSIPKPHKKKTAEKFRAMMEAAEAEAARAEVKTPYYLKTLSESGESQVLH
jgi:pseudouridine-5'-phosphate glycosidase